jgi:hypothetical protein
MGERTTLERIIDAVARNLALFLVILGTTLALLAANGGFPKEGIRIEDVAWRVFLAVAGVVVGGFGVRLIWRGQGDLDTSSIAKDCELKITSPRPNEAVNEKIELQGTYKKKPPKRALVAIIERTPSGGFYFKEQTVQFREKDTRWSATIYIGGNREERTLQVGILGEAGEALRDYFIDVRRKFNKSAGVKTLTPDVALCDDVDVYYGGQTAESLPPKPGQW